MAENRAPRVYHHSPCENGRFGAYTQRACEHRDITEKKTLKSTQDPSCRVHAPPKCPKLTMDLLAISYSHEPRQKPISFAMSLGYAYAGACALLTRTQCYLTREQWEQTSLRGAYALGNLEKMIPLRRFCLRHRLFSPSNMFAALALWGWKRARGRRRGRRATRQRGNVLRKFQKQFQRCGFFGAMWATQKVKFSLRAAYAELTRSLRGIWP